MIKINLREYQEKLKNKTRQAFMKYKRVILLAPCGGGKTVIASSIIKDSIEKGKKVWFVVHRRELQSQAENTLERYGIPTDNIRICMVQTLANKLDKIEETPDMIIFDECFIQGTLVDGKPIENIKVGDYVKSYNHKTNTVEFKKVLNVFKTKPKTLLKIKLSNGEEIICTSNHPFYTKNGYIEARKLKEKDELFLLWEKSNRRKNKSINKISKTALQRNGKMVLFSRLYEKICNNSKNRNNEKTESRYEIQREKQRKNEKKQSYEYARYKRQNDRNDKSISKRKTESWRKLVQEQRWKWNRIYCTAIKTKTRIKKIFTRNRIYNITQNGKRKWLSDSLQNRYCITRIYDSNRNRWQKSQFDKKTRTGQKERRILKKSRVESIEIQKQTSDGTFGGMCKDGYVYNIEVEDNNNYFANNVLVHNCQHCTSKTYLRIIEKYKNAYILGLTATPCRLTGKPLGDIFETIVSEITAKQLINMKFLASYDYYAPDLNIDLSNIKMKSGDYDAEGISKVMSKAKIFGDIIKTYKKIANNKKTILYCANIEYSKKMEELFTENGYSIKHFDGNTPKSERDQIIEDFRNNKIQMLTNVDLIGEGFDVPDCECVLLLRPTQSLTLYIQSSTRCLRPNGDKKAIIIDYVNNIQRHGMPTQDREWSLDTKVKEYNNENEDGTLKIRICPECFSTFETAPVCPFCGAEYQITPVEILNMKEIELKRIEEEKERKRVEYLSNIAQKVKDYTSPKQCKTWAEITEYAKMKGYKPGYAYVMAKQNGIFIPKKGK